MKHLSIHDLAPLARGAAILGSGGGGDPAYEILMAQYQVELHGDIPLMGVEEIEDDALIVPIAWMGAPLISQEKLPSGKEFFAIFDTIEKRMNKRPTAICPAEIGGANAFAPLCVSGMLKIPVLDADTIGRAFPEVQMSVCNLFHISPTPAFLADSLGNCFEILQGNAEEMEKIAREKVVSFGSSCAIACYLMTGREAKKTLIRRSISKAIELGKTLDAKEAIASGMIVAIQQEVKDGFLEGSLLLDSGVKIVYQNEYLFAYQGSKMIGATPDILVLLEQESGNPITSESLQYGVRVHLLCLPSPDVWKSEAGLKLVGPEALCIPLV